MDWSWESAAKSVPLLLEGLLVTVEITLLASVVAYALGLVFALIRRTGIPVLSQAVLLFIEFVRSTPLLIQVFVLYYVIQPVGGMTLSPFTTGVIALGVHYATYAAEVYRAGIEAVPKGQWEATTALNLPRSRVWTAVVLPQAVPRVLPALGNYTISMFKETPLLLAIGVVDVLARAKEVGADTFRVTEPYTLAGVLFLLVSLPASILVRRLERRAAHS
ncbi:MULTISPECIES: ectoine/hydroxyectoine ABC transporter permease subunit EhuD [Amycolatopsis]|uniref:Amino acid ABC transporter membrane protein n=2 Tax=Amycolatopsis keratiniphila TaxID=129921 RepID=R4TFK7_9PSEU|nr:MULTISPECIES: ectoine/hydroxyectoine ABC transporter permease subunit EhuD [Amycolatopsis]AGM09128.1 amino acid ABC transporter membrane protein [Amycolatopsis keratiniphila]OLZ44795.1 ectoine/hydroxyectoine ABC transporter permease subunit EhuD [Amycolatopsis keratiniphila subsp. nogabecina]ONF67998.1 ectoine/hydroxyectoine ABC transporter permease subunit EhuD [Amycolatopsis keratiniphila subsp. keratiniphila]UMP06388.1 ectoine/hydroxyectoine ABC transporter permease subunit EhuD [Amycolat